MKLRKYIQYSLLGTLLLSVVSLLLSIWLSLDQSFYISFGLLYLLIPGVIWSFVLFPPSVVDPIERAIFALLLSIVIVPLTVLLLSKLGMSINTYYSFFIILGIDTVGSLFLIKKNMSIHWRKRKSIFALK